VSGVLIALYFIFVPAPELLTLKGQESNFLRARAQDKDLRWLSLGQARVQDGERRLALFSAPTRIVADYQDEGFLRIWMDPNVADNAVIYGPEVLQIFVNGRKLSCRKEGDFRRLFYPILNNREPCER
jgi:hypothetical protein